MRLCWPILVSMLAISFQAGATVLAEAPPPDYRQFSSALSDGAVRTSATDGIPELREKFLRDSAMAIGSQGGLRWRSYQIIQELNGKASDLDRVYRFSALISKDGLLPPVIVEAKDAVTISGDIKRISDRAYKFVREARFVSVAPSWRDYLFTGITIGPVPQAPHKSLMPKNEAEKQLWSEALGMGWVSGIAQADAILEKNLALLGRDMSGMLVYTRLQKQGMVAAPSVSRADVVVTGNRKELVLGDGTARIEKDAGFYVDPGKWKVPVVNTK